MSPPRGIHDPRIMGCLVEILRIYGLKERTFCTIASISSALIFLE